MQNDISIMTKTYPAKSESCDGRLRWRDQQPTLQYADEIGGAATVP